jgi:hypothetical protein
VIVTVATAAWWFWSSRQYDKLTTLDFDHWVAKYHALTNPGSRSRSATAFVAQSIDFAWKMGAINSKDRESITRTLKKINTTTIVTMWFGQALPAVENAVGSKQVAESQARMVGMMMLLAWMAPERERENAVRQFFRQR